MKRYHVAEACLIALFAVAIATSPVALTRLGLTPRVSASPKAQRPAPDQPEQYEGQHQHKEPAADLWCAPKGYTPKPGERMIECACHKKCAPFDPTHWQGLAQPREVREATDCSVYCYKQKCKCPAECET